MEGNRRDDQPYEPYDRRRWIDKFWVIFGTVTTSLLLGIGSVIWADHETNRAQAIILASLQTQFVELKQDLRRHGDIVYTRRESEIDFNPVRRRQEDFEQRLRVLEAAAIALARDNALQIKIKPPENR